MLRPGGTLMFAEIAHLAAYRMHLETRGVTGVKFLDAAGTHASSVCSAAAVTDRRRSSRDADERHCSSIATQS